MFNNQTLNSSVFNSSGTARLITVGDIAALLETIEKTGFDVFELGSGLDQTLQSQGSVVTAATSTNDGSTRTPSGRGTLVSLTTGDMVMFYQAGTEGTNGLMMRTSPNRGVTWSSETQISSREDVYPSAVVQRDTNDIHLVYSRDEATPTTETASSVYYRRFIYTGDPGIPTFSVGAELIVMPGAAEVAYERSSIDIDDTNVPFCFAVRHHDTEGSSVACAIGAVAGNLAGAKLDTSVIGINLFSPDITLAAAHIGSKWFCGLSSGGTFWLTKATGPNVGLQEITFTSMTSWGVDSVHMVAVSGKPSSNRMDIAYIKNGSVYFTAWDDQALTQMTTTLISGSAIRVAMAHDSVYAWVYFVQQIGSRYLVVFSQEEENFATGVLTQTTAQDWDWPNAPSRIDDAQAGVVAWCTTSEAVENIYVSSSDIEIPKFAAEAPIGIETIGNSRSLFELNTVQDVPNIGHLLLEGPANVAEEAEAKGTPRVTELVNATYDINRLTEVIEAVLLEELLNLAPILGTQETGAAVDDATFKNRVSDTDTGTATEVARPNPRAEEVVAFTDAVSQLIRVVAETSSGLETLVNGRRASDTGAGSDASTFYILAAELATVTFLIEKTFEALENGVGTDIVSGFNRPASDTGTATDVAKWEYVLAEIAAANDISASTVRSLSVLLRLLVTKSSIRLRTEGW